jgi:thioredoxin 1
MTARVGNAQASTGMRARAACRRDMDNRQRKVGMARAASQRMPMTRRDATYQQQAPERAAVEAMAGLVLLDFGTDWCGHCIAARAPVDAWLDGHAGVAHLRVEDGRGGVLGRAYRVKLWPTLVLLRDGHEIARVVRPQAAGDLQPLDAALA